MDLSHTDGRSISLPIHHKSILTCMRIKRKLYLP